MDESQVKASIQKLVAGDSSELAGLLEFYRPRLKAMVRLRVAGPLATRVDASDILQDVFIEASRKVDQYIDSPSVSFFVWIRSLTQNAVYNVYRTHLWAQMRSIKREVDLPSDGSEIFARQLISNESPSRIMARDELRSAVKSAIAELPEADQEIVLMRHFEWLTNKEVAETLGISATAATMRHGRALLRLKSLLKKHVSISSENE